MTSNSQRQVQQQRLDLKRKRVSKACGPCKQRKTKCSADLPCKHCSETGDFCYYPQSIDTAAATSATSLPDGSNFSQEVFDRLQRLEQTFESIGIRLYEGDASGASASVRPMLPKDENAPQVPFGSHYAPSTSVEERPETRSGQSAVNAIAHPAKSSDSPSQVPPNLGLQILENASSLDLQQHREDRKGSLRFLGKCS